MKRKLCRLNYPYFGGNSWASKYPFHSFRSLVFSPLIHGKLPTDVQISISNGYLVSESINLFFYLKENLLIFINKTNPTQMHSHTHKISETSVRIAGKQLTVMVT